jgi:hypothetical protein
VGTVLCVCIKSRPRNKYYERVACARLFWLRVNYAFNVFTSSQSNFMTNAGSIRPTHSPNPTKASSSAPQTPRMVISSPSSRNVLFSPPFNVIVSLPFWLCSKKLPYSAAVVPLMVPEPSKSPGWKGHPLMVWCASICGNDHIRFRALTFDTVVVLPEDAEQC